MLIVVRRPTGAANVPWWSVRFILQCGEGAGHGGRLQSAGSRSRQLIATGSGRPCGRFGAGASQGKRTTCAESIQTFCMEGVVVPAIEVDGLVKSYDEPSRRRWCVLGGAGRGDLRDPRAE